MDLTPYSDVTSETLVDSDEGVKLMANGCLMMMKEQLTNDTRNMYVRHLFQLTEFPSDNVIIVKSTPDNLWYSFNREHIPDQFNTTYLWYTGYKIIMETNQVINKIAIDEASPEKLKQYVGEAYFYRALVYFDLARVFSFPPSHGTEKPGVVVRTTIDGDDSKARSTVGDTYKQIISDLRIAAGLLSMRDNSNINESAKYGNKWAAYGLLSRAYLFTQQYDSAIYFANKLISEGPYNLEPRETYINSFWNSSSSDEGLFVIYYDKTEDKGGASIGSMYNGDGAGWGEVFPSKPYQNLVARFKNDIRNQFIDTIFSGTNVAKYPGSSFEMFYINKFSNQDGIATLNSPACIRLSEVYLNRAEAYAHTSQNQDALNDVNTIRERAGLSGEELVTLTNLTSGHGYADVLDAVLTERRLELAFEGHRRDDLLRNQIDLNRSYVSAQNMDGNTDIYPYNGPRQVYFIPLNELIYNPACVQND
ncbi:MAG: RagB/SusD family nutrient uptake outer membrane protein [Bacteroidales bacterium]|nr:RagB/SusD family nutrient uptake outer membrane protein [Bacteroidales bacterium]